MGAVWRASEQHERATFAAITFVPDGFCQTMAAGI